MTPLHSAKTAGSPVVHADDEPRLRLSSAGRSSGSGLVSR